jgi:hypothetical protein
MKRASMIRMHVQIVQNADHQLLGLTKTNGIQPLEPAQVTVFAESVRENLHGDLDSTEFDQLDLNIVEQIISHAIAVTSDPVLSPAFAFDFDLGQVRSAKAYILNYNPVGMGHFALVEAYDKKIKHLEHFSAA